MIQLLPWRTSGAKFGQDDAQSLRGQDPGNLAVV
jgi:hypothetical protein